MKRYLNTVILAALLAACTDYVQEIDNQYDEWKAARSQLDEMTDSRDGQTYKIVTIGTQTWMAENLNYETENSYCYNDSAEYCAKYGRLYTWAAAMEACPSGWHLPDTTEWNTLASAVGGESIAVKTLKSASGWSDDGNGSDAYAFSILPAGYYNNGKYISEGLETHFWESTELDSRLAYHTRFDRFSFDGWYSDCTYKSSRFSVRCIKDDATTTESSSSKKNESSSSIASSSSQKNESSSSSVSSSSKKSESSSSDTPKSSSSKTNESSSSVKSSSSAASSSSVTSSSSEEAKSSSSKVPEPAEGTLTDSRDGKTYKTVFIGTQTWMAENLNYETENSYCYVDETSNCVKYGRLYTWAAAMDSVGTWSANGKGCGYGSTCSPTGTVRGVCPEGWHLPDMEEWNTLFTAVGGGSTAGKMLKSTSIDGTDAYAFSALPAGHWVNNGSYDNEGYYAYFWSSTESSGDEAFNMYLHVGDDYADLTHRFKLLGFSVRCVKDEDVKTESSSSKKNESSSSIVTSSSSYVIPCRLEIDSSIVCEDLLDSRDGQIYKTIVIGSQTWMAENLNYKTENSSCYDDVDSNCVKYGRLYTWAAAMDSAGAGGSNGKGCGYGSTCSPSLSVQGVCPNGWHLPAYTEFETLFDAVGGQFMAGRMLKSTSGWNSNGNGTDFYAFSALPARYKNIKDGYLEGNYVCYWSSAEKSNYGAYYMNLRYNDGRAYLVDVDKDFGFSVRCVKDN